MIRDAVVVTVVEGLHGTELLRGIRRDDLDGNVLILDCILCPPYCATSPVAYFTSYEISTAEDATNSDGVETAFAVFFNVLGGKVRLDVFMVYANVWARLSVKRMGRAKDGSHAERSC